MRRMSEQTKNTIKELALGFVLGAILMGSFLFFGLRARAEGVDRSDLSYIPRHEVADMRAREPWVAPEPEPEPVSQTISYTPESGHRAWV